MRTPKLAATIVLVAATLAANAQPRSESAVGPFTYEAVGATPSLAIGRKDAPKAAEAPRAARAGKTAAAPAAGAAGVFTYDALGATPAVEVKKPGAAEMATRQPAR